MKTCDVRNRVARTALAAAVLVAVLSCGLHAAGDELHAFMTVAVRGPVEAVLRSFEQASGDRLVPTWGTSASLNERVQRGEAVDVLVSTRANVDVLKQAGLVAPGTDVDIARVGIGVAVRAGAPKPDISTVEAFKAALLAARAVGASDPAAGGVSGVHLARVLAQLGIAEPVKAKSRYPPAGGLAADLLVKGEVDLAVQQLSELRAVKGVDIVGPLPGHLQLVTTFAAVVPRTARQPGAGARFIAFLQSPAGRAALSAGGLEPLGGGASTAR